MTCRLGCRLPTTNGYKWLQANHSTVQYSTVQYSTIITAPHTCLHWASSSYKTSLGRVEFWLQNWFGVGGKIMMNRLFCLLY